MHAFLVQRLQAQFTGQFEQRIGHDLLRRQTTCGLAYPCVKRVCRLVHKQRYLFGDFIIPFRIGPVSVPL